MQIDTLGCDGGIGGTRRTTCYRVDQTILIDAGTGLLDLPLEALEKIDHIFLTHSHFDHILGLPLLLDSVYKNRQTPVTVHALPETIAILQSHIFNWKIWPDFSLIPRADQGALRCQPLRMGKSVSIGDWVISPLPVNHVIPAIGYALVSPQGALAISGDTTSCEAFWNHLNRLSRLDYLIVETSFPNDAQDLAKISKHFCPSLLQADLKLLNHRPAIFISHLKPGFEDAIMAELQAQCAGMGFTLQALQRQHRFKLG